MDLNMKRLDETVVQEQFDELLLEVTNGESIVILRKGKEIARMVPHRPDNHTPVPAK